MYQEKREQFNRRRRAHWDGVHQQADAPSHFARSYRERLAAVYRHRIPTGASVLEIGCGNGRLLRSLCPSRGLGIDFSEKAVERAKQQSQEQSALSFVCAEAGLISTLESTTFDFIILSDVLNDLWDVQQVLKDLLRFATRRTRLLINMHSHVWKWPLRIAQSMNLAQPTLEQNWLTVQDLRNLFHLTGWEFLESWPEVLFPTDIPCVGSLLNRWLGKLFPLYHLCLTNFVVGRPFSGETQASEAPSASIVVPARNEAGNIAEIFRRVPKLGGECELIFVEGGSSDDTRAKIEEEMARFSDFPCRLFAQTGSGKRDAVRLGFEKARGDVLMILDADLTVAPEELPKFYDALVSGRGEFINGVRLVYPLEQEAMQFCNLLGNRFFSQGFSWVLGQPIKDTLCGTKVMWRTDYEKLVANRPYFGDFDPFGDFDLLFGAAKLNLKILDLPIRYFERQYGTTNISRWRHGFWLLLMLISGARRLKFI